MRRHRARGFTLVEIMIVIAIIGILTLLILPNMVKSKYQAEWTSCSGYERTVAAACESYQAQYGSYPPTLNVLTTSTPQFISLMPTCPSNGVSYAGSYLPGSTTGSSASYNNFTIYCPGAHHIVLSGVQQGYPQYNPQRGALQYDENH